MLSLSSALICILYSVDAIQSANIQHSNIFVPTNEWKFVEPGQQIPSGLHVRMNIQTGYNEAKLMEPGEVDQQPDTPLVLIKDNPSQPRVDTLSKKQRYKELPHVLHKPEDVNHIKERFRSYDQLKKDFASINMRIKTDAEIITGLVQELHQYPSDDRVEFILEDLSYLLHQVDNGKYFADQRGLLLLVPYFRSKDNGIQRLALNSFSAAVQGNADVKIIALQYGLLEEIRNVLSSTQDGRILSAGLSTLSTFLRGFPSAQKYFFAKGISVGLRHSSSGFDLLNDIFTMPSATHDQLPKLWKIRIVSLLGDIQLERNSAKKLYESENRTDIDKRLWELYSAFDFESGLRRSHWCDHLTTALLRHLGIHEATPPASTDHDSLEKLLTAADRIGETTCRTELMAGPPRLHEQLVKVEQQYALLAADERQTGDATDTFYSDMQKLVQSVMNRTTPLVDKGRPIDEI